MRKIFEPIRVETDRHGTPARVVWRRRLFMVSRVVDCWRYRGKWWLLPYGQRRLYYRIEARPVYQQGQIESARLLEVFEEDGAWTISYLCD